MPDRSFQDYVTSRFEDEIYQAVEKFVSANRLKPEFTTKKISYPSSTALDRIWIKSVTVNDLPKMEIEFIVTVEAQIDLQVVRGQWDDFDECFPWIQLKCRGDLDQSLDDFEVTGIRTFDKSKPAPRPLDDALVPYLKKENYEEEVRTFLKRNHYSEMLLEPQAIDPMQLAQRMGLTVLRRTISQDYSIFGEIFFADCDTEFYDPEKEQMVPEHVQAKTIVVDPQAYFLRNLGSYNLTIVHECVHWDRHRKAFKLEQLYNRNAAQIKCEVVGGIRNTGAKCATDWKEQQAQLTKALFYLSIVTAGAILALKASGTWEFIEMLAPMHILVATALAYTIWMYVKAFRKNPENVLKPELFCMILIAAGGMADLIAFYSGAEIRVGTFVRITVLIYALNLFRICILITYRGLRERAELERQLQKSRVELMTSQIQPHFIYNTLNSIRTLIKVDPEAAYQTTYDFSNYLRGNLNSMEGREKIPFSEELRHIQAYVNIEKIRFEDRIQVEFLLETRSFQVPALSVQPLVENAIKHGLCKKIEGGTVWVRSYETADSYVVEVEDNGIGFDINALENQNTEHTSIGLNNIRFRVTALSGGDMEIKSSPGEGARVTLRFPRKKREV